MKKTLLCVRLFFFIFCLLGSFLFWYTYEAENASNLFSVFLIGGGVGVLVILIDILLKGFSLRGLSALAFGLAVGALIAFLIGRSPIFDRGNPDTILFVRLLSYLVFMYLGAVIAIRGKDDFNLVIPYVRFLSNNEQIPTVILDASSLIDGRIATVCQSRFINATLLVPKFVLQELHTMSGSEEIQKQIKGRKGIEVLNKLKNMSYIDLRVKDIDLGETDQTDSKLIFLAQSLKAKLMTTDYNLAKLAEFHGIIWLNLNALSKALNPEVSIGQYLDIELVKAGKEGHQGVGYLADGSMVVVNEAFEFIGKTVVAEVISVLPSAGGKMIFARLHKPATETAS